MRLPSSQIPIALTSLRALLARVITGRAGGYSDPVAVAAALLRARLCDIFDGVIVPTHPDGCE